MRSYKYNKEIVNTWATCKRIRFWKKFASCQTYTCSLRPRNIINRKLIWEVTGRHGTYWFVQASFWSLWENLIRCLYRRQRLCVPLLSLKWWQLWISCSSVKVYSSIKIFICLSSPWQCKAPYLIQLPQSIDDKVLYGDDYFFASNIL